MHGATPGGGISPGVALRAFESVVIQVNLFLRKETQGSRGLHTMCLGGQPSLDLGSYWKGKVVEPCQYSLLFSLGVTLITSTTPQWLRYLLLRMLHLFLRREHRLHR